jgi:hypothetical protein
MLVFCFATYFLLGGSSKEPDKNAHERTHIEDEQMAIADEKDFVLEIRADGETLLIKEYVGKKKKIKIPESIQNINITEIGSWAFRNKPISEVILPDTISEISLGAFQNSKLTKINFPDSIINIEQSAFMHTLLEEITFPKNLRYLGSNVFTGTKVRSVDINLPSIRYFSQSYGIFSDCRELISVAINDNITDIPTEAFSGCLKLQNINLPAKIEKIGSFAFSNCESLVSIIIPENIIDIDISILNTFYGCKKLNLETQARLRKLGYEGSF